MINGPGQERAINALFFAVKTQNIHDAEALLKKGVRTENEWLIRSCAMHGHDKMLQLLLSYGISPGNDPNQPLLCAASSGYTSIIRILLEYNHSLDVQEPLKLACLNNRVDAARLLTELPPAKAGGLAQLGAED